MPLYDCCAVDLKPAHDVLYSSVTFLSPNNNNTLYVPLYKVLFCSTQVSYQTFESYNFYPLW